MFPRELHQLVGNEPMSIHIDFTILITLLKRVVSPNMDDIDDIVFCGDIVFG